MRYFFLIIIFICIGLISNSQEKFKVNLITGRTRDLISKSWSKPKSQNPTNSFIYFDKNNLTFTVSTSDEDFVYNIIENYALKTGDICNFKATEGNNISTVNDYIIVEAIKVDSLYKIFLKRFTYIVGLTDFNYLEDLDLTYTCIKL